jgi:probable HAF family extracellular repeat protein
MFTVTDLVPGAILGISRATAISPNGVVVGTDSGGGFIWTPNQPNGTAGSSQSLPTDLSPAFRPATATARAVNAASVVVGSCATEDANGAAVTRAFSFAPGGVLNELGTFVPDPAHPGHFLNNSEALGIDSAGRIVGWAEDANGIRRAFLFDPVARLMQDLSQNHSATLPPGTSDPSEAAAINDSGLIVGTATFIDALGATVSQAFITSVGAVSLTGLGTLLPSPFGGFLGASAALALNKTGVAVGTSDAVPAALPAQLTLGVIFSTPSIPFGPSPSVARGINSGAFGDKVVGNFVSNPSGPVTSGFVGDLVNGMIDLNTQLATPDWRIDDATGINDFGQICGVGTHATLGGPRAVLLTP